MEQITITPEVWTYHVFGFNRTVVRDLMRGDIEHGRQAVQMCTMRGTTGATSDRTVKRWQQGEDIYLNVMLKVCDELRLDPLRWICVDGEPVKSKLEDLYLLEQSGTDCATLLRERGIEPTPDEIPMLLTDKRWKVVEAERKEKIEEARRLGKEYEQNKKAKNISAMTNADIIYQVAQIQREAFEHENHNVAAIRREYQNLLETANIRAGAAENEVSRLREALRDANEQLARLREELDSANTRIAYLKNHTLTGNDTPEGMIAADDAKRE